MTTKPTKDQPEAEVPRNLRAGPMEYERTRVPSLEQERQAEAQKAAKADATDTGKE